MECDRNASPIGRNRMTKRHSPCYHGKVSPRVSIRGLLRASAWSRRSAIPERMREHAAESAMLAPVLCVRLRRSVPDLRGVQNRVPFGPRRYAPNSAGRKAGSPRKRRVLVVVHGASLAVNSANAPLVPRGRIPPRGRRSEPALQPAGVGCSLGTSTSRATDRRRGRKVPFAWRGESESARVDSHRIWRAHEFCAFTFALSAVGLNSPCRQILALRRKSGRVVSRT